ncbi:MAG: hypothetical protein AAF432_12005 [Planctomycetota bacterium]
MMSVLRTVHGLALAAWLSLLVSAGIGASFVFGTLTPMPLHAERFDAAETSEHGRLVAGVIMDRVFRFVDIGQGIAAGIVLITFIMLFAAGALRLRRWSGRIHCGAVCLATMLFALQLPMANAMRGELQMYWSAVEAGEAAEAENIQTGFNTKHNVADAVLRINLLLLITATGALIHTSAPRRESEHAS